MNDRTRKLRTMTAEKPVNVQAALHTLEAPAHATEKQIVLKAVKDLGLEVNAAEVAATTGMPYLNVTALLNRIAYETQGHLQVDTAGGFRYKFEPHFESHYLLTGSRNAFRRLLRIAFNTIALAIRLFSIALVFAIRVSFGIILIASVVVVVVVIVAAVLAFLARIFGSLGDWGGDGGGDVGGGDGSGWNLDWLSGFRFWTLDWTWDWFYWPRHYIYWDACDYQSNRIADTRNFERTISADESENQQSTQDSTETHGNFLDNCFTVLFGGGNPNANLESERWPLIARAIKAKSGVVLAEDLAPYVVSDQRNEDWMLPILIRFDGCPEVTDQGKLVYKFPEFVAPCPILHSQNDSDPGELNAIYSNFLKRQSAQKLAQQHSQQLPAFLQEQKLELTGLSTSGELMSVMLFACIATGGTIGLMVCAADVSYVQMLRPLLLAIAAYGGLFFLAQNDDRTLFPPYGASKRGVRSCRWRAYRRRPPASRKLRRLAFVEPCLRLCDLA